MYKVRILINRIDFIQLIHALGAEGRRFESSLPDHFFFIYMILIVPILFFLKSFTLFFGGEVLHFSSIDVLSPFVHGLYCQPFLTCAPTVVLHHLQGFVAGDTLDLLRGTASLIQGRCCVLS